jgi:hypothetical protein
MKDQLDDAPAGSPTLLDGQPVLPNLTTEPVTEDKPAADAEPQGTPPATEGQPAETPPTDAAKDSAGDKPASPAPAEPGASEPTPQPQ